MFKNKFSKFTKSKNVLFGNETKNKVSLKEIKLQMNITIISICVTVLAAIGTSLAAFVWDSSSNKNQTLTVGTYSIEIDDSSPTLGGVINLASAYPLSDNDGLATTAYKFSIKNNGNVNADFVLKLSDDQTIIDSEGCANNLISRENIKINMSGSKSISTSLLSSVTDNVLDSGVLIAGETRTYELRLWISDTAPNDVITQHFHGKLELQSEQVMPSLANEPVLADGMIPVVYNDTDDVWEVANTTTTWYDYNTQMWANAVTVSDATYRTAEAGTPIPMDVINSMWVWIPRFKYRIPSSIGSDSNVTSPPQIDVVFESGTDTTGVSETVYRNGITSDGTNTNYYTHPAFRNIDNIEYDSTTTSRGAWDAEITGFWVGKFETSIDGSVATDSSSTCYSSKSDTNCNTSNLTPIIKPDVESLNYQNVSNQFLTSLKFANGTMDTTTGEVTFSTNSNNIYGLNTTSNTVDTHMMKNTEWGAVAILSQSQYGKMGNKKYTGTNKEIYKNNSYNSTNDEIYTGRSSGVPPTSGSTTYGTYSYNNKTCTTTDPICTGEEVQYAGTGASTTGTIYGIYDMSGGTFEYTMGNWAETSKSSGFTTFPTEKYYDLYQGTNESTTTKEKVILGDSIYESMKWYSDYNYFVYVSSPWASLGGSYNASYPAGIFSFSYFGGAATKDRSFRSTLIP
ncbi:MAG: hypothetical protein IJO32_06205 [Bacilli bacterium]|nr:hypothetical protein [Bacilli bacterium]